MGSKITFFGHATIGIETGKFHLIVDPYFKRNAAATTKSDEVKADYLLITHGHGDHLGDAIEISALTGATVICNTEIGDWLDKKGVKTSMLQVGGSTQFPFGHLRMTFALHGSSLPDGTYGGLAAGFLLNTLQNEKIYLAGDTGLFGDMALIGEEGIDLAMLPIGGLYTMDPPEALRALKLLKPKVVIPIHYNTMSRLNQDADKWKEKVEAETKTKVVLLKPGEGYELT